MVSCIQITEIDLLLFVVMFMCVVVVFVCGAGVPASSSRVSGEGRGAKHHILYNTILYYDIACCKYKVIQYNIT